MLITRISYSQPANSPKKVNIRSHDHLKRTLLLPLPKSLSHPQLSSIASFRSPSGLSDIHITQAYHFGFAHPTIKAKELGSIQRQLLMLSKQRQWRRQSRNALFVRM
ncbi:hypothetical protein CY34DRAFT_435850 [Suillus luteus UH-Slu-Lm8-n1]|uniref:Uncharacterized protein n=1 Tax=Suillus luteus UH-Slu-Lm8-n1 TaxID=930992 RepID=A0A0D0BHP5_9AGAM|nr:hypothetical protein CY34DRAFT_435850 [Suillus luteus UH-Slu-Lm8-n1]